jgi:hypothetical protein
MPRRSAGQPAERKPVGPERPADFDRLPKRYKEYISAMERRLGALERLLEELPQSPVKVETYESNMPARYLPENVRLSFALPDGKIEVQIGKRRGTDTLQISSPDGRLLLYPEISNEVGIKVGRI